MVLAFIGLYSRIQRHDKGEKVMLNTILRMKKVMKHEYVNSFHNYLCSSTIDSIVQAITQEAGVSPRHGKRKGKLKRHSGFTIREPVKGHTLLLLTTIGKILPMYVGC